MIKRECPLFIEKISSYNSSPSMYTLDWLYTLYSRGFDHQIYRLAWDLFLIFGDYYLLKAGVVIFKYFEHELMTRLIDIGPLLGGGK